MIRRKTLLNLLFGGKKDHWKINHFRFYFPDFNIPIFSKIVAKRRLGFLRGIVRGYNKAKSENIVKKINDLFFDLEKTEFCKSNSFFSPIIFGDCIDNAKYIIRQNLLVRTSYLSNPSLTRTIFFYKGINSSIPCIVPKEWRRVVKKHGFDVNSSKSYLYWNIFLFFIFLFGVFEIFSLIYKSIINLFNKNESNKNYIYFNALEKSNLPNHDVQQNHYDIISWYNSYYKNSKKFELIIHNVSDIKLLNIGSKRVIYNKLPFPLLNSLSTLFRYIFWGIKASFLAFIDIFRGRWWHALLLSQAAELQIVKLSNPDLLAQEYLFHNSNFALRPMWTYQAEKYGSKIIFYFYSINQRTFTKSDGFIPKAPRFFKSAIWPHYLAWDKHHADFIKKSTTNNPIVDITEPIPFNNSLIDLPYLPNKSIAVFDIQPYRNVFYKTLLFELDYYIPFTVNLFINELYEVINELRGTLAFKQKRDIGRAAHHKYINNIKNYKNKENFIFINTKTSAFDLIKNTKATISMPFTSTAHLAKSIGKPSIYFDPSKKINKNDLSLHDIEIIYDKSNLKNWLKNIIDK